MMKVLKGGRLIDGTGAGPVTGATVVIRDQRIEAITTKAAGGWPDDAEISAEDRQWREHLQRPETIEFIRLYYAIPDPKIRRQFLEMAKTVAESFEAKV